MCDNVEAAVRCVSSVQPVTYLIAHVVRWENPKYGVITCMDPRLRCSVMYALQYHIYYDQPTGGYLVYHLVQYELMALNK